MYFLFRIFDDGHLKLTFVVTFTKIEQKVHSKYVTEMIEVLLHYAGHYMRYSLEVYSL